MTGIKFGRLTALEIDDNRGSANQIKWKCECECGNLVSTLAQSLLNESTASCECYHSEIVSSRNGADLHNWKGGDVILSCEECGDAYAVSVSRKNSSRFCSHKCHGKWQSRTNVGDKNPSWNPDLTDRERRIGRKFPGYKNGELACMSEIITLANIASPKSQKD
ncbi:MAG: hypothetical protein HC917_28715 [Richelia sp. SM2_1_7]|nr:hypothetical protein [Richelia sp. SM2_1_7]